MRLFSMLLLTSGLLFQSMSMPVAEEDERSPQTEVATLATCQATHLLMRQSYRESAALLSALSPNAMQHQQTASIISSFEKLADDEMQKAEATDRAFTEALLPHLGTSNTKPEEITSMYHEMVSKLMSQGLMALGMPVRSGEELLTTEQFLLDQASQCDKLEATIVQRHTI